LSAAWPHNVPMHKGWSSPGEHRIPDGLAERWHEQAEATPSQNGPVRVGVMGIRGSFSEEAALEYARDNHLGRIEIAELVTTARVLAALEAEEIDLGVFALENSHGGVVYESVYAMATHRFHIEDLFEIDVNHTLLVHPGLDGREGIDRIATHQQAFSQCRMWLRHHFPLTPVTEEPDTAEAARLLASGELPPTTAVIAAERCAELFGLRVLERRIQDLKFNFTTFVAASRMPP
jgi:prephenate dehydratase